MFEADMDDGLSMLGFDGMGAVANDPGFGMGAVSAPSPSQGFPTSGDSRQKSVNAPAQIRIDAANLRELGYAAPDTGNAYDPKFMAAVRAFQANAGPELAGTADGLMGPTTRALLVDAMKLQAKPGSSGASGGGLLSTISTSDGGISPLVIVGGLAAVGVVGWLLFGSK